MMSPVFSKNLDIRAVLIMWVFVKEFRIEPWCVWGSSSRVTCTSHISGMPWNNADTHFLQQTYPRHPPGLASALILLPKYSLGQPGLHLVMSVSEMQHGYLNSWNKGSIKLKMNEDLFLRIKLLKSVRKHQLLSKGFFSHHSMDRSLLSAEQDE